MVAWLPWQRRFLRRALSPDVRTAAFSAPRGNGKSTLIAALGERFLTPGDPLHKPGTEAHIIAYSLGQARRTVWRLLRESLEPVAGYRWAESHSAVHCIHVDTGTRLSVLAANGKASMGLTRCPIVLADEAGSWETIGGELVHDAIQTAMGKPGASMRVIYTGTLAPSTSGWWHDMVTGGHRRGVHTLFLQGDRERWDHWPTIKKCNPLMARFPESRRVLLDEREEARRDAGKLARFCSYRLNIPTRDAREVVLSPQAWDAVTARTPAGPDGRRPVVGVDLGESRAWSAAVAVWPSGYTEAIALTGGAVSLADQEKRDRIPSGTYQRLADAGRLIQDEGLQVPRVSRLVELIRRWRPRGLLCDRFKAAALADARPGCEVVPRLARWSECTEDIEATRRLALDGNLNIDPASAELLGASMAATTIVSDDQVSVRIAKSKNNASRDDVIAALVLACGGLDRLTRRAGPYEIRLVRPA